MVYGDLRLRIGVFTDFHSELAGRDLLAVKRKGLAAIGLAAVGHFDARHAMGGVALLRKEVKHELQITDGIEMAVDVDVRIPGRVCGGRRGCLHANAAGRLHGAGAVADQTAAEFRISHLLEVHRPTRGFVNESPHTQGVAEHATVGSTHGIRAVRKKPVDTADPRFDGKLLAGAGHFVKLDNQPRKHPRVSVLLRPVVAKAIMGRVEAGAA